MATTQNGKQPAHRPSRRQHIIGAAVRVFGRKGFAETSVQDIADEAQVVPTAVYYHFDGKEELLELAMRRVFDQLNDVVEEARPASEPGDAQGLLRVIDAVWDWVGANPDEARLFQVQVAAANGSVKLLRDEFEQRHIQRAYDYLPEGTTRSPRAAKARHAAQALAVRTLISTTMLVTALRAEGGPLAGLPPSDVQAAVRSLALRIVAADQGAAVSPA
ncbi:TetR/AcrR family transcriptional regulator [Streptomyces sporangiiformans]|uniref:TetR/AcrR family transcriptional regulator n=1 Tax=Streptomyces sporangiiformans TaxID=2315329 RepID=A0A505DMI0_9ACTN|nr:TetR/AcrR family transcriptional regulator [Streptomyces sporangiiformans]TPQ21619.1 TetR/AcrR family transcriptional regulator [Streptomyces sporangiiformans]